MEIDEIIREGISKGEKEFYWSPEDYLRLAAFATRMGWGMTYMGVTHHLKDVPRDVQINNSSTEDTQV